MKNASCSGRCNRRLVVKEQGLEGPLRAGFTGYSDNEPIQVMMSALMRSIKKAPTMPTMSQDCGMGPYYSLRACMFARPFAVAPKEKPMPPTVSITAV